MKKKLIFGGAAVLALATALPLATAAADQHRGGHHGKGGHAMDGKHHGQYGGPQGRARAKIRLMEALERFDQDNDGSITQAEVDQFRADRLKAFDKDGNGSLSLDEYEALWLDAMRKRMVRAFQRHDADGDGNVTSEEFAEMTKYMVLQRDRNGDGVLNEEDIKHEGRRGPGHRGKGPRHRHGGEGPHRGEDKSE